MRVTLNWLKDYVDIDMTVQHLADLLTMTGLEVEGIEPIGQSLEKVRVVKVESVVKHPQADRLFICHVDTGTDHVPVVCGAPNLIVAALFPWPCRVRPYPTVWLSKKAASGGHNPLGCSWQRMNWA